MESKRKQHRYEPPRLKTYGTLTAITQMKSQELSDASESCTPGPGTCMLGGGPSTGSGTGTSPVAGVLS